MEPSTLTSPTTLPSLPDKSPLITSTTLPSTTTGTDTTFRDRAAMICARAGITDAFTLLLTLERLSYPPPSTISVSDLCMANLRRLDRKISNGGFIVEAADFAAVACWEPPSASVHEAAEVWDGLDIRPFIPDAERRPIFLEFLHKIAEGKRKTFPKGTRYWHLSLMARDPERRDKGVVRAVIEPFVERARREGVPAWLEAGNERAREVYGYFGFREVGKIMSGVGEWDEWGRRVEDGKGKGVATWLMVANWPVEDVKN